jgi:quercetin dioxygenase-like cupin family protein
MTRRMSRVRNRLVLALAAAVLAATAFGGVVLATPSVGVTAIPVAAGNLDALNLNVKTGDWKMELRTKGQTDVSVVENHVAPGGAFGWHSHPGPSVVIVKAGVITFYTADDPSCSPRTYHAGDSFVDPGNVIHIGRNEGTQELVVVTVRFVPHGAAPRIDQPSPGNCTF